MGRYLRKIEFLIVGTESAAAQAAAPEGWEKHQSREFPWGFVTHLASWAALLEVDLWLGDLVSGILAAENACS
ncbi:hypothetical protein [Teichococcus aestuarii]|nr:hypothetical protein [Pseudoroseomonas aestuarii]